MERSSQRKKRTLKKVVRFASESETQSGEKSDTDSVHSSTENGDVITCLSSEQLYSDDTFISDSQKDKPPSLDYSSDDYVTFNNSDPVTSNNSDPSYDSNSFADLNSEDETGTLSDYSYMDSLASSEYTDSLASSGVFYAQGHSDRIASREIVKDIGELEVSVVLSRTDTLPQELSHEDEAEITESHSEEPEITESHSEEPEITESHSEETEDKSKNNFILSVVAKLKLKDLQSPRSLDQESMFPMKCEVPPAALGPGSREKTAFYQRMMKSCQKTRVAGCPEPVPILKKVWQQPPEYYGLRSNIVDRLRNDNFRLWTKKKMADIERDTEQSREYVRRNQHVEDDFQKQQFISQMKSGVLRDNMDDNVQAHLINMDPAKWFSGVISDLPRLDEGSRDILYRLKRQAQNHDHHD